MNTSLRNEQGFTLIELLVSVGIVGILSATAVMTASIYRDKAYNANQKQLYLNARTALEGRDEGVDNISASFRRIYQYYESSTWQKYQVTNNSELAPGIPSVIPEYLYLYIRENKCSGPSSTCYRQYIYSGNCKTGNRILFIEYSNGYIVSEEGYNSAADNAC